MALTDEDLLHLARLSRLRLSDDERAGFAGQLQRIVAYVALLSEVDVDGVEPMTHAVPMQQRRRPDVVAGERAGRRAVRGSAGYADGRVQVPKVIE